MKTLQEEIIELLKNKIGVADGAEFYAEDDCIGYGKCKIFEGKLLIKGENGGWEETNLWKLFIEYFEDYKFERIQYKPQMGDWYSYVNIDGIIVKKVFIDGVMTDYLNRYIGNCFRTNEHAEAHKREILEMLGIKLVQKNSLGEKNDDKTILL